jgi:hypothetical protein
MSILLIQERINQEIAKISQALQHLELFLGQLNEHSEGIYTEALVNSIALNLQGIYTGIERIFEVIATEVDHRLPTGDKWHRDLLEQMTVDIPNVRKAVIMEETRFVLDELRRFRHVVRSAYSFQLDQQKVLAVATHFLLYYQDLSQEIKLFCDYLSDGDT